VAKTLFPWRKSNSDNYLRLPSTLPTPHKIWQSGKVLRLTRS